MCAGHPARIRVRCRSAITLNIVPLTVRNTFWLIVVTSMSWVMAERFPRSAFRGRPDGGPLQDLAPYIAVDSHSVDVPRRLRLGEVRVYYDVRESTVEVLAVVPKSEAAEWLKREGRSI